MIIHVSGHVFRSGYVDAVLGLVAKILRSKADPALLFVGRLVSKLIRKVPRSDGP